MLETPHQGTSNEYPQSMFSWRNEKSVNNFGLKKAPYLELCLCSYLYLLYLALYTVDPIYRGAWGPSSASAIYPDRDISHGGSLSRRR